MKYKIAEYVSSIQDGGAETLVKDYALMLDRNKFDVVVIVMRRCPDTANDKILSSHGIKIISIYKNNSFIAKVWQRLNRWWYVPYKLQQIIEAEKVNVIHVHLSLLKYVNKIRKKIDEILKVCE